MLTGDNEIWENTEDVTTGVVYDAVFAGDDSDSASGLNADGLNTDLNADVEIWENIGDANSAYFIYQGTIVNNIDDHGSEDYQWGEIIRINHDKCNTFNP